jgi:hypothetical protein
MQKGPKNQKNNQFLNCDAVVAHIVKNNMRFMVQYHTYALQSGYTTRPPPPQEIYLLIYDTAHDI